MDLTGEKLDRLGDPVLQINSLKDHDLLVERGLDGAHQQIDDLTGHGRYIIEKLLQLRQDGCRQL